ncbi:MAG: DUF2970 domain-containing protein [Ferrimonas sp.]
MLLRMRTPSTLWRVLRSVFAAFLGVQTEANRHYDFQQKSPWPFIILGIAMAGLVVLWLVALVYWVLAS